MTVTQDYKNLTIRDERWTLIRFMVWARVETTKRDEQTAKRAGDIQGEAYWNSQHEQALALARRLESL